MKKTWKEAVLTSFTNRYSGSYTDYKEAVENGCNDDREVFMKLYEQIVRAVSSLPGEPDSYIRVAMWRQMKRDKETPNNIMANFCD